MLSSDIQFTDASLNNANFSSASVRGKRAVRKGFNKVSFDGVTAEGIDFSDAWLSYGVGFADADLRDAKFRHATIATADNKGKVDFSGADLRNADFSKSEANGKGVVFEDASLQGSDWQGALLYYNADLKKADFGSADFTDASMYYGIDASNAIFDDAKFDKANLYAMKFDGASFARASFKEASIGVIDNSYAETEFKNADFTGANFDGASIYGFIDQKTAPTTVFDEAILTGTSWDEAYIHTGVQFEGAKFDGSTFTGATGEGVPS